MASVQHLSKKSMDHTTKLPIWEFTVYGGDDSILYSFHVFAAKSTIPGAGTGVFLVFTGAKRLNEAYNTRQLPLLDLLVPNQSQTIQPLQAYPELRGIGLTVHLNGENLHGKNNCNCECPSLQAKIPKYARKCVFKHKVESLTIKSEDDLQLDHFELPSLQAKIPKHARKHQYFFNHKVETLTINSEDDLQLSNFELPNLQAKIPKDARTCSCCFKYKVETLTIKLENDLHSDNFELPSLQAKVLDSVSESCLLQPVGHHKVSTICDYEEDDSINEFFTNINCIDLGCFGPFRQKDRKPEDFFALKSFIFSQVPSEWGFGAAEKMHGMQQMIDITDDVTGLPIELNTKEVHMYVNEVGHNLNFTENVYIADSIDNRSIQYYFMPEFTMKKGEPIELLANYGSTYEEVRQRKGYGRRNIKHGLKSSECNAANLKQNFLVREDVESILISCESVQRLHYLVKVMDRDIYSPIIQHAQNGKLSFLQLIALRRTYWLTKYFRQKIKQFSLELTVFCPEEGKVYLALDRMEALYEEAVVPILRDTWTARNEELNHAVASELLEEMCFDMKLKLPNALDSTIYCPIALCLIESICAIVVILILQLSQKSQKATMEILVNQVYELTVDAKCEVLSSDPVAASNFSDIQFKSHAISQIIYVADTFATHYLKESNYSLETLCNKLDVSLIKAKKITKLGIKKLNQKYYKSSLLPLPNTASTAGTNRVDKLDVKQQK